ncbi:MAG: Crp/Fnr family transcriptional regulator [Bacteroidales bacterium]|nr:Crp/Fnr family transcriptional regulator [Bacteroidales bacterium]
MIPDCTNCGFKSFAVNTLDFNQIAFMQDKCTETVLKRGEVVYKEGASFQSIAYIRSGLVKLHKIGFNDREQILKIVKAPNYVGIPIAIGHFIAQYSVTVLEDVTLCFISIDTFKCLLDENKNFAYQIIVDLCKNELDNYKNCLHKVQKHSAGLLADALLNFASSIYNSLEYKLPLSRQELADLIGTSRENVSRMLSDFQRDGILKIENKYINIVDVKRLKLISGLG